MDELEILESEAAKEIAASENPESIEKLRLGFLGKKGKLSLLLGGMKNLSSEERPLIGQRANVLKTQLQELIKQKLEFLKTQALNQILINETIDVTAPPTGIYQGHRPLRPDVRQQKRDIQDPGLGMVEAQHTV